MRSQVSRFKHEKLYKDASTSDIQHLRGRKEQETYTAAIQYTPHNMLNISSMKEETIPRKHTIFFSISFMMAIYALSNTKMIFSLVIDAL